MTQTRAVSPGVEYAHRIGLLRFEREPDGTWLATADCGVTIRGREKADARRGILVVASIPDEYEPPIITDETPGPSVRFEL